MDNVNRDTSISELRNGYDNVFGRQDKGIQIISEPRDRLQVALDKTLGLNLAHYSEIKPFTGLREAYVKVTGDSEIRGRLPDHVMRSHEAIVNADFPKLLGVSMNRRMVADYRSVNYSESRLISHRGSASELKKQESISAGHYPDPPIVDPEIEDYLEPQKPPEESVEFDMVTRGEATAVTRQAILNDDTGGLERRIRSRARAYHRGFARFVWSFYFDNSAWQGDAVAWFAAGHGNLKSQALAALEVADAVDKLMAMIEPGSGETLGLDNEQMDRLALIVGNALWKTARNVNQAQYLDDQFTPNPVYRMFGANNERIIINPLETDANNWGVIADPTDRDILEVRFLYGRQEPEFILAKDPTGTGALFNGDKLVYKDRFEYGGDLVNFHGAVKSIVA